MNERQKAIVDNFDTGKIGFDEKFSFHCTQCGACCINRDDILLTPKDLFFISKELKITQQEFIKKYCEIYVGPDSRVVLVRLQPVGRNHRCPLLKNHHCIVHSVKPAICAMFPLGRRIRFKEGNQVTEFSYFLQSIDCGDRSEEFTVRKWLAQFGMQPEDEFSIEWLSFLSKLSMFLCEVEKHCKQSLMEDLRAACFAVLYFDYSMEEDFMTQFRKRLHSMKEFIDNTPTCKS